MTLETKADKSLTIPPPNETIQSDLLKLSINSFSIILFATLRFFIFSLAANLKIFRL